MRRMLGTIWGDYAGLAALVAGLLLAVTVGGAACATDLQVRVTQPDGRPLPDAVVTVHALDAGVAPPAPVHAVMDLTCW